MWWVVVLLGALVGLAQSLPHFNPFANPFEKSDPHEMIDELADMHPIAVLSTFDGVGGLSSRPMWVRTLTNIMGPNATDEDRGIIVLGTDLRTQKVAELQHNSTVNVLLGNTGVTTRGWVEIKGEMEIVTDPKLKKLAWTPSYRIYFSSHRDENYCLLVLNKPYSARILTLEGKPRVIQVN
ncbi:hypothetical protein PAPYR_5735 [Paratrimastix pyriformis]|uniref:Pyridoxamine 5'-phosphate oxidase N-terminal domain-containing protein n=1 Tax=Paratrimastix pyriformis TaxID=342808 RepID=A0ABQ8ULE8_9EUKA|nr:hypothetical protein PAPYR_5735 [Paratrimastix pyriformis]